MSMYFARIVPVDHAHTAMAAPTSPRDRSRVSTVSGIEVSADAAVTRAT